jgi:hypothetical protein
MHTHRRVKGRVTCDRSIEFLFLLFDVFVLTG